MRVLGIDVGFAICGWSIVDKIGGDLKLIDFGVITTSKDFAEAHRLNSVYDGLMDVIDKYQPEHMAIEDLFFFKNQKTVIKVGQVRGVIMLAGEKRGLAISSYTPLQVKTAVTGYGRAEKDQVQKMVKLIFKLKEIPRPDDAADAVAVSVCHLNTIR